MDNESPPIQCLEITDKRWSEYVRIHPEATIFHHPSWAMTIAQVFQHKPFVAACIDSQGQIVGGLPVMEVDSWLTGKRWVSLSYTDHCSALLNDKIGLGDFSSAVFDLARKLKVPKCEVRYKVPMPKKDMHTQTHYIHYLKLDRSEDELFRQFRKKGVQYCINKGLSSGVKVVQASDFQSVLLFYELHSLTRKKLGVPVQPKIFFVKLWENMLRRGMGFTMLALQNSRPVAGGIFLCYKKKLVYKYGATDPEYMNVFGNHVLLWELIQWGCRNGIEVLDWGRTEKDNEGLRGFKLGWGTSEEDLTYTYVGKPAANHSKGIMKVMMEGVIHRSPVWVGRLVGEVLYKHMG